MSIIIPCMEPLSSHTVMYDPILIKYDFGLKTYFIDIANNKWYDPLGEYNHATLANITRVDHGVHFNGFDSGIYITNDNQMYFGANDFSFAFWFKSTSAGYKRILSKYTSNWEIGLFDDGAGQRLRWRLKTSSVTHLNVTQPEVVFDGIWHHVVWCVDRRNKLSTFYIDGVKSAVETDISSLGDGPVDAYNILCLGNTNAGAYYINMDLNDFFIFKRVITESEAKILYNNTHAMYGV